MTDFNTTFGNIAIQLVTAAIVLVICLWIRFPTHLTQQIKPMNDIQQLLQLNAAVEEVPGRVDAEVAYINSIGNHPPHSASPATTHHFNNEERRFGFLLKRPGRGM